MFLTAAVALLPLFSVLSSTAPVLETRTGGCSVQQKIAGVQYEIDTITSHSWENAEQIPLAPSASRTFLITPNELDGITLPPVNVGISAATVRTELVALATVLDAAVPPNSVRYFHNRNGSVTVDFIQTDRLALPRVHVREIHTFNDECQITSILGYVHGAAVCPKALGGLLSNPVVNVICNGVGMGL